MITQEVCGSVGCWNHVLGSTLTTRFSFLSKIFKSKKTAGKASNHSILLDLESMNIYTQTSFKHLP